MALPKPPAEVPRQSSIELLHPAFRARVERILADVQREKVFETVRTEERQRFLYGFGREYDDPIPRGPVTKAKTAMGGWHFYRLATDIVEDDATPWIAPNAFWQELGLSAERHGCKWGGRWKRADLPHVQMGGIPVSPTARVRQVYNAEGLDAVWAELGLAG